LPAEPGPADPDAYAALEEQRDFLLASLDDLERERAAGDIDEVDYEALRDDYTARAAAVLRALEEGGARYEAARPPGRWRQVAALVAVVAVLGVGAGVLVARSSGSRPPGASATGDVRLDTRDQLAQALDLAAAGEVLEAIMLYDEVLEVDPENVEALTYRGWLLVRVDPSLRQDGLGFLEEAVALDPDYPDARIFLALTYEDLGRLDEARAQIDAVDPDDVPLDVRPLVEGLRDRLDSATGSPTSTTAGD
jgi:tetratricopeptide (TPR) repeat protein